MEDTVNVKNTIIRTEKSEDNCIEIQSVDFKCSDDGFLLSLMVNGLFTVTDSSYSKVADELSSLMEVLIK